MSRAKYSDEEFIKATQESNSYAEVARKLGLIPRGGNYKTIKNKIKKLGLDTSHMTGQGWNVGLQFVPRPPAPLEELLVNGRITKSSSLRQRLIREGIKEERCESCRLDSWLGKKISLELDHIDGDHNNNLLENLRILCPNCHAQTETYRGKNIKLAGVDE